MGCSTPKHRFRISFDRPQQDGNLHQGRSVSSNRALPDAFWVTFALMMLFFFFLLNVFFFLETPCSPGEYKYTRQEVVHTCVLCLGSPAETCGSSNTWLILVSQKPLQCKGEKDTAGGNQNRD